ncbi:MAG TPA: hypothetical protein VF601_10535 [Beijerinckiaceae bacterium]|jgi:hypothetical protein
MQQTWTNTARSRSAGVPPALWDLGNEALFHFEEALARPAEAFAHPRDVVSNPRLSLSEKRAILAAWASDACAVEAAPALRLPPGGKEPVLFDDVMDALRTIDEEERAAA